jgi:hypothetical protein
MARILEDRKASPEAKRVATDTLHAVADRGTGSATLDELVVALVNKCELPP